MKTKLLNKDQAKQFVNIITALVRAASKDEYRETLNHVIIQANEKKVLLSATNGHSVLYCDLNREILPDLPITLNNCVLLRESCEKMIFDAKLAIKKMTRNDAVQIDLPEIQSRNHADTQVLRKYTPDEQKSTLALDAQLLSEISDMITLSLSNRRDARVIMSLGDTHDALRFRSDSPNELNAEISAMLMPMRMN